MKAILAASILFTSMAMGSVYQTSTNDAIATISLNQAESDKLVDILSNDPTVKVEVKTIRTTREVTFSTSNTSCTVFLAEESLKTLATTCEVQVVK